MEKMNEFIQRSVVTSKPAAKKAKMDDKPEQEAASKPSEGIA